MSTDPVVPNSAPDDSSKRRRRANDAPAEAYVVEMAYAVEACVEQLKSDYAERGFIRGRDAVMIVGRLMCAVGVDSTIADVNWRRIARALCGLELPAMVLDEVTRREDVLKDAEFYLSEMAWQAIEKAKQADDEDAEPVDDSTMRFRIPYKLILNGNVRIFHLHALFEKLTQVDEATRRACMDDIEEDDTVATPDEPVFYRLGFKFPNGG